MTDAPFRVGGLVEPPYFVGRSKELAALTRTARQLAENVLVLAPRRYGKSSLLHNLRCELADEDGLLIPYANCREITSYADFHRVTVAAVLAEYERKRPVAGLLEAFLSTARGKLLEVLGRIEQIGGSVGDAGKLTLRFREREIDEVDLLRGTFAFLRRFTAEKDVRIVILMDEFQEVTTFNGFLFGLLKKELDENVQVRYVFCGSSIRMLSSIFLQQDAPLYLMVGRHRMGPLSRDEVAAFVRHRLQVAKLSCSESVALRFHELTGGIPFYVQKLGLIVSQLAYLQGETAVSSVLVEKAFRNMLDELDGEFETRWVSRLSSQQRRIVRTLARIGDARLTDVAEAMRVDRTDISSALRRLRDMMIVTKTERGRYTLTDTVFAAWLQKA